MVSADDFRPEYLRLAQAEQEHSERRNFPCCCKTSVGIAGEHLPGYQCSVVNP